MKPSPEPPRTIWILTHRRIGDLKQMRVLAEALGWPTTVKRLSFRLPKLAAIPFLARRLFDPSASDPLDPPWPDLVLCAEGRASTVARSIQERSGGAVRTVCLGRPAGSPANFDLVLTTPQYRLPAASNIVELALPLAPATAPASPDEDGRLEPCPRPLIAVLVGGTSLPERLDRQAAISLARDLVRHADEAGGTLHIVTSPRTDRGAAVALTEAVAPPHSVHLWRRDGDDVLRRVLAGADHFVVTSDSVSMVVDGLTAGKPVSVYRLGQHHTVKNRAVDWLYDKAHTPGSIWSRPACWMFDHGIIEVRPDRRRMFENLVAEGRLQWFAAPPASRSPAPARADDLATAVARVAQLFSSQTPC